MLRRDGTEMVSTINEVDTTDEVMRQAKARIFRDETRSEGRTVSLFEPSTEVIRKGKAAKPTEFGKLARGHPRAGEFSDQDRVLRRETGSVHPSYRREAPA
jgi:hypothetical protein